MGHNDADPINTDRPGQFNIRARGSLPGIGEESEEIENGLTKQHETVYTFGHYMRKFINESKARGATPIVASLTVHNDWTDGKIQRDYRSYRLWAEQLAKAEKVMFVDLNNIAGDAFDQIGQEKVKPLFPMDNVHNGGEGSDLNAQFMVAGLKGLPSHPLDQYLNDKGKSVPANTKYPSN
jgi:lysophospholipase L1-like esterase